MEDTQSLVDSLITWTGTLVPDRDRATKLERDLRDAVADGTLDPNQPLTRSALDAVEAVCHRTARHLTLDLHDQPGRTRSAPARLGAGTPRGGGRPSGLRAQRTAAGGRELR